MYWINEVGKFPQYIEKLCETANTLYDAGYYNEATILFFEYNKKTGKGWTDLGIMFLYGRGVCVNYEIARNYFEKAIAVNDRVDVANHGMGILYQNGWGVDKNLTISAKFNEKSAKLGYKYAQYDLGLAYLYGNGVECNRDEAKKWLKAAAAQNYQEAIDMLNNNF